STFLQPLDFEAEALAQVEAVPETVRQARAAQGQREDVDRRKFELLRRLLTDESPKPINQVNRELGYLTVPQQPWFLDFEEQAQGIIEGARRRAELPPPGREPVRRGVLRPEDFTDWRDRPVLEALFGPGLPRQPEVRPLYVPPGAMPVSLIPDRPGPTRAQMDLLERYPHLRKFHLRRTRDIPPEPGLTGEILSLPFRVLPAEAIGRALGWSPESERAITRFVEQ